MSALAISGSRVTSDCSDSWLSTVLIVGRKRGYIYRCSLLFLVSVESFPSLKQDYLSR